jgi:cell division protein FtsQ
METQMTNSMPSVVKKKKQQRKRTLKKVFFWLKAILFSAILLILFYYIGSSPFFNIKNITIIGMKHYAENELIQKAGIVVNKNGFEGIGGSIGHFIQLRYGVYEKAIISKCPYIKNVQVQFKLPSTVSIVVEERQPVFLISHKSKYIILSREGIMVELVKARKESNLPEMRGVIIEKFISGQAISISNMNKLEKCIRIITSIDNNDKIIKNSDKIKSLIKYIDISLEDNVRLNLEERIDVNLGDLDELDYKIRAVTEIVANKLKKSDCGTLDFTTGENPIFMPR